MADNPHQLSLFEGSHVPRNRYLAALERLDFAAAAADAPESSQVALAALRDALGGRSPERASLAKLVACRKAKRTKWPAEIKRAWQHVVGLRLDATPVPGVLEDELAAAFLLQAGELARAERSLRRHLAHQPRDARGWELFAEFEPVRGAVRCAFHGGSLLPVADHLSDLVEEDELDPVGPWLLAYAWMQREIGLGELRSALAAEGLDDAPQLLLPGDARAFTWHLVEAGGRPLGDDSAGVVAARKRLREISPPAFRRYMTRMRGP